MSNLKQETLQTDPALLYLTDTAVFTNGRFVATLLNKPISAIFLTTFVHVMSLSHLGNSGNISDFFIIIFVMVLCDQ